MLPARLRQLKSQIEAKSVDKRTLEQRELLSELQKLDSSEEFKKAMGSGGLVEDRSFAGPSSSCKCCGATL